MLVFNLAVLALVFMMCWNCVQECFEDGQFAERLTNAMTGKIDVTFSWWFFKRPFQGADLFWTAAGLSFQVLFPLTSEVVLRRKFGRSPSPEIFFLRMLLLTLPLQAVRLMFIPVGLGQAVPFWAIAISRISWFARLFGIIAAMNIGLYSGELPFRRAGSVLSIGALAVLTVAVMVPLDVTQLTGNLMYRSVETFSLALVALALELLAVMSLAGTAASSGNSRYYILAASLFVILLGVDFSFFVSRPLVIPGAVMMAAGLIMFSRQIRKIYQWI